MIVRMVWRRVLLCACASARRNGLLGAVECAMGESLIAPYEPVHEHVPGVQVDEAVKLVEQQQIDVLLGLGGGSPLGLAKAVSFALEAEQVDGQPVPVQARIPVIAVPTTYAGSEMTPTYGV